MIRRIARIRAGWYARIVRLRMGSDTPAYAAALAEIARLDRDDRGGRA